MVSSPVAVVTAPARAARTSTRRARRAASCGLAILAVLLLPVTVLAGIDLNLDGSASGTTVSVAKGAAITVTLESNASTGYHWIEATTPDAAVVAEDTGSGDYIAPETTLVGAAGKQVFRYHGAGDGSTTLVLHYVAPGTNEVGKTFTLTIAVGPVAGQLDASQDPPATTTGSSDTPAPTTIALAAIAILGLGSIAILGRRFAR